MNFEFLEIFYLRALNGLKSRLVSQLRANRNTDGITLKRYELALEKGYIKSMNNAIKILKQEYKDFLKGLSM